MNQITRKVTLDDLRGLLENPPRANIAFVEDGNVYASPVLFHLINGRYFVGAHASGPARLPASEQPVVLLIDDGYLYFELRGVRLSGRTAPVRDLPEVLEAGAQWLEVISEKATAWHYGTLRKRRG